MPDITLAGCQTTPMASYLKALGVFRVLAEQIDPNIKGWWAQDTFTIRTALTFNEVIDFFLNRYTPLPVASPWNGGSGFGPRDAREGMDAILGSQDPRFAAYRDIVQQIRAWPEMPRTFDLVSEVVGTLEELVTNMRSGKSKTEIEAELSAIRGLRHQAEEATGQSLDSCSFSELDSLSENQTGHAKKTLKQYVKVAQKARNRCLDIDRGDQKSLLFTLCRARLPEKYLSWLDAVVVIKPDGQPGYNTLLGSGGNEGRLDLSNNYMQRLAELLISGRRDEARPLLEASLLAMPVPGLTEASIGQFDPGRAGGFNQGCEVKTKDFKINPWDYILTLEGAAVMVGSVAKRHLADIKGLESLPFTVRCSMVGFSSGWSNDDGRAEIWLPTWPQPAGYPEVRFIFSEGRSSVAGRPAGNGLDFSRAISTLGVDRGLNGFVRYSLLKRRGDSFVALPAGHLPVRYQPSVRLLDELDSLIKRLDGFLRDFVSVPASFKMVRRQLDEAIFECSQRADAARFNTLIRVWGRMEKLIALRDRTKEPALSQPLGGLSTKWITQCDDGSVEVRLAAALASISSAGSVGPIRANMAGVDPAAPWKWASDSGRSRNQMKWFGQNFTERLGHIVNQRLIDAGRAETFRAPWAGRLPIYSSDVSPFLYGATDDPKIEELLWGFTLIKWDAGGEKEIKTRWSEAGIDAVIPRSWALLKLLFVPGMIRDVVVPLEPRLPALLMAGRVLEACQVAVRRLRAADLRPLKITYEPELDPIRLLAGLLVPIKDQRRLETLVLQKP